MGRVLWSRLLRTSLIQPGHFAVNIWVLCQTRHGINPLFAGRLAVDVIAQHMVHDDSKLRNTCGQNINFFYAFDPFSIRQNVE